MATRVENINATLITWAITRAGNTLEEFYADNPEVLDWVEGKKKPTIKQLENFTHKVHVPFGYMFMNEPPNEDISIPFFRTGAAPRDKVSLNVYHTIQIIKDRQNWLTNYLQESGYSDLDFVGKYNDNADYKAIANDIRKILNLPVDWVSQCNTWEQALDYLTLQIEEIGIIINFNGIVGNNTGRKIAVEECRGFVLVHKKAPFLFINSADAKAAQMFTLLHEIAHIWLGESAGFNNKQMLPADDPTELLCDKVAAEFLVPEVLFREKWNARQNSNLSSVVKNLSKTFKVSPIVIARRALDLDFITKSSFFKFYNQYISEFKKKKENQSSGGNFYTTVKKRISLRFARYVNTAVNESSLLYRDAYKLTSLKGNTYEKFVNEYLYQV